MSDITKCRDENCPSKLECYRYTASADSWQSYFAELPRKENESKCKYFWKVKLVTKEDVMKDCIIAMKIAKEVLISSKQRYIANKRRTK